MHTRTRSLFELFDLLFVLVVLKCVCLRAWGRLVGVSIELVVDA
jgi:hypothetical protein